MFMRLKTTFKIWHELSSHRWVIFICFFAWSAWKVTLFVKTTQHTQADPVEESAPSLLLAKPSPQGPTRKRHRLGAKNRIRISPHFFQRYVVFGQKMDHCLNASLPCLPIDGCIDKARSIHSTSTKQPTKDSTRGQALLFTRAKAITKRHLKHPTL